MTAVLERHEGLHTLRRELVRRREDDDRPPPRTFYPLIASRKPSVAIVRITSGAGHDPDELKHALSILKRRVIDFGLGYAQKRRGYPKPSERRRFKTAMARRRARRSAVRSLRAELRREARGR